MTKNRSGKIINIGSGLGILGGPRSAAYSSAKHGLIGLTRSLAVDLGPSNINVNCICPSTIDTPLSRQTTTPEFREAMIRRLPLGRLGKVSDIGHAAVFLASEKSSWITGAVLPVDGGLTCCLRAQHPE